MEPKTVGRKSAPITYLVLAVAAISFLGVYIYRKMRPPQHDSDDENETVEENTIDMQQRRRSERRVIRNQDRELSITSRLFGGPSSAPKKKTMSISMKNVLLWNPSSDPESPNHAFFETIVPLLNLLSQSYEIHLICPVSSIQEKEQILNLLRHANLLEPDVIDERKVLFCETQEGKVHIIRHIEANIHIEGGINAEDTVEMVRGFVGSVIWAIHGGSSGSNVVGNNGTNSGNNEKNKIYGIESSSGSRGGSDSNEFKFSVDRSQWTNVEICQNIWSSSLKI